MLKSRVFAGCRPGQVKLGMGSGLQQTPLGGDRLLWEELRVLWPLTWGLEAPLGKMEQQVHVLGQRKELAVAFTHPGERPKHLSYLIIIPRACLIAETGQEMCLGNAWQVRSAGKRCDCPSSPWRDSPGCSRLDILGTDLQALKAGFLLAELGFPWDAFVPWGTVLESCSLGSRVRLAKT